MCRRCIQMTQVVFSLWTFLILAIEHVCELEADLTAIPPREFVRKRAPDGTLYYKLLYSIGMTFRNTIAFELIFNGKVYETVFAKYA